MPLLNRLGPGIGVGLKSGNRSYRQAAFDQSFDILQQFVLVHAHQGYGFPGSAGAAGSTDTVHVVFRHAGQFVVDHMRQIDDIDAARGNVSRHQNLQVAGLEFLQRTGAGCLALVAVDRQRLDAVLHQLFRQSIGAMLGAGEHQHLKPVAVANQISEQFPLALAVHRIDRMCHVVCGGIGLGHLDQYGIIQQASRQLLDLIGEGGGEQQILPLPGQQREDLLDVADEPHVQHAVGFIEHQYLDLRQVHGLLLYMVEQAAGGGHQNVHPAP